MFPLIGLGYRGFTIYDMGNTTETKIIARGSDISIENQLLDWSVVPREVKLHCQQMVMCYIKYKALSIKCFFKNGKIIIRNILGGQNFVFNTIVFNTDAFVCFHFHDDVY